MIRVANLKKQFDARGIAGLHGVSLELKKGEIIGVLGPNGSGKTTLMNLISGRIPPDSGKVEIDGEVSQFPRSFEDKDQNVQKFLIDSVHLEIDDDKKIQLARDLADTFEFTFQLRQNLKELSSGQRQKVLLAKELINRPSLLLMDEPFTHLDPFTRKDILNSLFQFIKNQEIGVLWVTHDLSEAFKFSHRIGILNFGKFEQLASPEEVIRKPRNLFVAQFVGYRNFFPVKFDDSSWSSGWGKIPFPKGNQDEAILVIPDTAWELAPDGPAYTVMERNAGIQSIEYLLQKEHQLIAWNRSPKDKLLEPGTQVKLSPRIEECFLIPL